MKMQQNKYFQCLSPSVKTSNEISGILMCDTDNLSMKLQKTLNPHFHRS